MPEYEYTISMGWDAHTHAGYANYTSPTPEEAVERRGTSFHPDFDCVVRREVGTEEWEYRPEDQTFDYIQKIIEYRVAQELLKEQREMWRPKQSSALPNNRRARTRGFVSKDSDTRLWLYTKGELDIERTFGK